MQYKFNFLRQIVFGAIGFLIALLASLRLEGSINWGASIGALIGLFIASGLTSSE